MSRRTLISRLTLGHGPKTNTRRRPTRQRLRAERLESRRLLAGDCVAELVDGDLTIACDDVGNQIRLDIPGGG